MNGPLPKTHEAIAERVFGKGLALEEIEPGDRLGFDLVWGQGTNGRDLRMVAGADNLAQDLKVALLTPTGTDIFNIRYGFDGLQVLTQPFDTSMIREFLRLSVIKTVALDARIKQILDVTLELTHPEERRWAVHVEAETILGDVIRLVLGEVDSRG